MNTTSTGRRIRSVLLILFATVFGLLLSTGFVLTRGFAEPAWDSAKVNPESIYVTGNSAGGEAAPSNPSGDGTASDRAERIAEGAVPIISPFHLQTEPMERLLLMNFDQDPDSVYVGFEPQYFDDNVHGTGLLVLGWRADGRIDVFHDPALRLHPDEYGIAGAGLNEMVERPFGDALFEIGDGGVQTDITFDDLDGRPVHLMIRETDTRPRTPFGLLAPMGSVASDPPALPLVYVDGFYFVRRAGTEYRIEIDGRSHQTDFLPLVLDRTPMYFLRYSTAPFIVTWNPDSGAGVRTLEPESEGDGIVAYADGVRYELEQNGAFHEIRRMARRLDAKEVTVEFTPAFPELLSVADGAEANGEFRITAGGSLGTVRGTWRVTRDAEDLHMELLPDGGWIPGPAPPMARGLFRAVSIFRDWPSTYVWRGTIQLPEIDTHAELVIGDMASAEMPLSIVSGWERITQ